MAAFNKFQSFVEALAEKKHDLGTDEFYVQLMNTAPDAANDAVEADLPADLGTGNGYTSGGLSCGTATGSSQTGGTYKLDIADKVITASGGSIGPFRYVVLFNQDATSDELIGYYDYGSALTLLDTESLTIDFDGTNGVLTIA
jgi:hypothetical protein